MPAEKTKDAALAALKQSWKERASAAQSVGARVMTLEILETVFEILWENQFLEDRRGPQREIERLVQLRIEHALLLETEHEN